MVIHCVMGHVTLWLRFVAFTFAVSCCVHVLRIEFLHWFLLILVSECVSLCRARAGFRGIKVGYYGCAAAAACCHCFIAI